MSTFEASAAAGEEAQCRSPGLRLARGRSQRTIRPGTGAGGPDPRFDAAVSGRAGRRLDNFSTATCLVSSHQAPPATPDLAGAVAVLLLAACSRSADWAQVTNTTATEVARPPTSVGRPAP